MINVSYKYWLLGVKGCLELGLRYLINKCRLNSELDLYFDLIQAK